MYIYIKKLDIMIRLLVYLKILYIRKFTGLQPYCKSYQKKIRVSIKIKAKNIITQRLNSRENINSNNSNVYSHKLFTQVEENQN